MTDQARNPDRFGARERRQGLLLISPTAIYVLLLMAGPLLAISAYSVLSAPPGSAGAVLTLKNYGDVLTDPIYRAILLRTMMVSIAVTLVTVAVAYPVAYFVSFHVEPSRKSLWLFLITIPFWTSYLIRVFLWKVILGFNGVINSGLMGLGIIDEPLQAINYNVGAVVVTLAHAYAPFAILPIFVALEKIDRSLLEASQDLGENKITTFLRVTLPLSVPGIVAAVLIVFIPTIGDYVTPELLGGAGGKLVANMIQTQFLQLNNAPLGAALALVAMLMVAGVSLVFVFLNRKNLRGRS